jgi:acyl-coenzyme A synthetase/AMP-(fatty) acid ligase
LEGKTHDDHLSQQNNKNECKKTKNFDISAQQTVAILFTSGTTGEAKKNPKTWGQLNESEYDSDSLSISFFAFELGNKLI